MVSPNVAVPSEHGLLVLCRVSVIRPPLALSFVPKLYVGVSVVPLVNVPSPEIGRETCRVRVAYPAGIVYVLAQARCVDVVVLPGVAVGTLDMVRPNVAVPSEHGLLVLCRASVIRPPLALSFVPKLYVGVSVVPLVNVPSP